jgi:hypothetical protein
MVSPRFWRVSIRPYDVSDEGFSGVQDRVASHGFHLIRCESLHTHRATVSGDKLNLVGRAVCVDKHNGADISGDESMCREILPQRGQVKLSKCWLAHGLSHAG